MTDVATISFRRHVALLSGCLALWLLPLLARDSFDALMSRDVEGDAFDLVIPIRPKREAIGRAILGSLKVLPSNAAIEPMR